MAYLLRIACKGSNTRTSDAEIPRGPPLIFHCLVSRIFFLQQSLHRYHEPNDESLDRASDTGVSRQRATSHYASSTYVLTACIKKCFTGVSWTQIGPYSFSSGVRDAWWVMSIHVGVPELEVPVVAFDFTPGIPKAMCAILNSPLFLSRSPSTQTTSIIQQAGLRSWAVILMLSFSRGSQSENPIKVFIVDRSN